MTAVILVLVAGLVLIVMGLTVFALRPKTGLQQLVGVFLLGTGVFFVVLSTWNWLLSFFTNLFQPMSAESIFALLVGVTLLILGFWRARAAFKWSNEPDNEFSSMRAHVGLAFMSYSVMFLGGIGVIFIALFTTP